MNIPQPTIFDKAALAGAEAAHHLATVLGAQWSAIWSHPAETLQAAIAAEPEKALSLYQLQLGCADRINDILDVFSICGDSFGQPIFHRRIPTTLPSGWEFTGTEFVYTPPEEPSND